MFPNKVEAPHGSSIASGGGVTAAGMCLAVLPAVLSWMRRRVTLHRAALAIGFVSMACGCSAARQAADAGAYDAGSRENLGDRPDRPDFLEQLASASDYALVQGSGGEVKFFAGVAGRPPPAPALDRPCVFLNTARYAGHVAFLRALPQVGDIDFKTYLAMVMKRSSWVLRGGSLKYVPGQSNPRTGATGVLAYFVYADPNDVDALTVEELAELDARLKGCAPYAVEVLTLVGMDVDQAQRFEAQRAALTERGVRLMDLRTLQQGLGAEGYVLGEGYGYLNIVPIGATLGEYGPRDILVLPSCPQDLGLVAGLVTATPQNLHSHVNLRLGEKRVPSAFVSDIHRNQVLSQLAGRLVHLVVTSSSVRLDPAPLETAEAFWASRRVTLPAPVADLDVTAPARFSSLLAADARAYGTKVANLGELHRVLPAANRVEGFGVPFSVYRDFLDSTGLAVAVDALLANPRVGAEAEFRDEQLAALVASIEDAPFPPELLARFERAARDVFGDGFTTLPLKFRSSSNAEDGLTVNGAGIYDSARGCFADDLDSDTTGPSACLSAEERRDLQARLVAREAELQAYPGRTWLADAIKDLRNDLTKERTVARAVKKVYGSLWSRRAFEERASYGIDHHAVFMGVAVEPSFVLERLDAVAVTHLVSSESDGGATWPVYRVVSQVGGEGVVRPVDPSAVAETMRFARGEGDAPTHVRRLTDSSLSHQPLWTDARVVELASLLFAVHDHFASAVYPVVAHLSLDLELKVTSDERIVIKQARPYVQPFTVE